MLRSFLLCVLLLCFILSALPLTTARVVAKSPTTTHDQYGQPNFENTEDVLSRRGEACTFAGNSDIYGFGIRLGFYLQWIYSRLSREFLSGLPRDHMDIDNFFLFALFVATMSVSYASDSVYSVELLIMITIFFSHSLITISTFQNLMKSTEISMYGTRVRIFLNAAMAPFAIWFWAKGVYLYKPTPCGSFAFLFAKVDLLGKARIVFIIFSSLVTLLTTILLAVCIGDILACLHLLPTHIWRTESVHWRDLFNHLLRKRPQENVEQPTPMPFEDTQNPSKGNLDTLLDFIYDQGHFYVGAPIWEELPHFRRSKFMTTFITSFAAIFAVLALELTIVWNGISGVYVLNTTGQLIPFVIGIGGLLKTLYEIYSEWYRDSKMDVHRSSATKGRAGKEQRERKRYVFVPMKGKAVTFWENHPDRRNSF